MPREGVFQDTPLTTARIRVMRSLGGSGLRQPPDMGTGRGFGTNY